MSLLGRSTGRRLEMVLLGARNTSTSSTSSIGVSASLDIGCSDDYLSANSTKTTSSLANSTTCVNITTAEAQEEENDEAGQRGIAPVMFAVVGSCRNCPVLDSGGFNLFDDSFGRRRRQRRSLLYDTSPTSTSSRQGLPGFITEQQTLNDDRNV